MRKIGSFLTTIAIIFCFSCVKKSRGHQETKYLHTEVKKDSTPQTHGNDTEKDIRYVSAENGLNYRDAPKGEIINKFPYNTSLNIVGATGIYQEITDKGKILRGEWLPVLIQKDTVYVFSAFLSRDKDVSNFPEENEFFIDKVEDLYKTDGYVREHINDSTVIRQIPVKIFMDIKKVSKKKFESVYNEFNRLYTGNQIKKVDSTIKIVCLNNKTLTYKDNYPEYDEQIQTYHYLGTFEKINSYLIHESNYEWGSYLLINRNSCESTEYNGYPVFNSDYSKMITIDTDSYEYSEFSFYTVENDTYKLRNTFTLNLIASDFVFDDENNLYLEYAVRWHDGNEQKKSNQYFLISFM